MPNIPKQVVFFNHWHNGDMHVSREFVRKIIAKVKGLHPETTFAYSHPNSSSLLADIPELLYDPGPVKKLQSHQGIFRNQDAVYLNTWYCQQNYKNFKRYHITIDCLYANFDEQCKEVWGFGLADITKNLHDWFPTIDYQCFEIERAKDWLAQHPERKVFISNGPVLSHQAPNYPFANIVMELADTYRETTFILSNQEHLPIAYPNVCYSQDIIQRSKGCDLNENSYLAANCDLIVGRASGAFTFAQTQDNFFKPGPQFLSFCNLPCSNGFWLGEKFKQIKYAKPFLNFNLTDPKLVKDTIEQYL